MGTCKVDSSTGTLGCTRMRCNKPGKAYCADKGKPKPCESSILDNYENCFDMGCTSWDDGCNSCGVDSSTGMLICTEMYCDTPGKAYCTDKGKPKSCESSILDNYQNCV